ncbi:MAG: methyltransferase [Zavarzinella sp.]
MFKLDRRRQVAELMDDPQVPVGNHHQALRGLSRINWFSNSSGILFKPIQQIAQSHPGHQLTLLDIATGGGDVVIRLKNKCERLGIPIKFSATDISQTALDMAAKKPGAKGIHWFQHNIINDGILQNYDIVISSLFIHHLEEEELHVVLQRFREIARKAILINDLRRCVCGWWAAKIIPRFLSRSRIVHFDGPVSVAGAFTSEELLHYARQAGWEGAKVQHVFPWRMLLEWHTPKLEAA